MRCVSDKFVTYMNMSRLSDRVKYLIWALTCPSPDQVWSETLTCLLEPAMCWWIPIEWNSDVRTWFELGLSQILHYFLKFGVMPCTVPRVGTRSAYKYFETVLNMLCIYGKYKFYTISFCLCVSDYFTISNFSYFFQVRHPIFPSSDEWIYDVSKPYYMGCLKKETKSKNM